MKIVYEDNYEVHSSGIVYSIKRLVTAKNGSTRKAGGRILKHTIDKYKYPMVKINKKKIALHKLIASLFVPNPKSHKHVIHKDNNKLNNNYTNLLWVNKDIYYKNRREPIDLIYQFMEINDNRKINSQLIQPFTKNIKKKLGNIKRST